MKKALMAILVSSILVSCNGGGGGGGGSSTDQVPGVGNTDGSGSGDGGGNQTTPTYSIQYLYPTNTMAVGDGVLNVDSIDAVCVDQDEELVDDSNCPTIGDYSVGDGPQQEQRSPAGNYSLTVPNSVEGVASYPLDEGVDFSAISTEDIETALASLITCNAGYEIVERQCAVPVTKIAFGMWHACFLKKDGSTECSGFASSGQLANGLTDVGGNTSTETAVSTIFAAGAKDVAAGSTSTCIIDASDNVQCVGRNDFGAIGDGNSGPGTPQTSVTQALFSSTVQKIAMTNNTLCGILTDGSVECSGNNNNGQVGDGSTTAQASPVATLFPTSTDIQAAPSFGAAGFTVCVLATDNTVRCAGSNRDGQLGNGSSDSNDNSTPVTAIFSGPVSSFTLGATNLCAILQNGSIECLGERSAGQFGDGVMTGGVESSPATIAFAAGATKIVSGYSNLCALLADNTVKCAGENKNDIFGTGESLHSTAITIPFTKDVVDVFISHRGEDGELCAVMADQTMECIGSNAGGKLALADANPATSPTPVPVR